MELYFCDQCEKRIPTADVAEAKAAAASFNDHMYCVECRPRPVAPKPATATFKAQPKSTLRMQRTTPAREAPLVPHKSPIRGAETMPTATPINPTPPPMPAVRAGTSGYRSPSVQVAPPHRMSASASASAARAVEVPARRPSSKTPLIVGVAIFAVCLIAGTALFFTQSDKTSRVAAVETEPKKTTAPTPASTGPMTTTNTPKTDEPKPAPIVLHGSPSMPANPIAKRNTPPVEKPKPVPPPKKELVPPAPVLGVAEAGVSELGVEALKGDAPKIDGLLDDAAWRSAATSDAMKLENGDTPNGKAKFWMTYDETNLYVAVQCFENATALSSLKAEATQTASDNIWMDDSVELFIDRVNSRHAYYQLIFNPKGVVWSKYYDGPKHAVGNWEPTVSVAANVGKMSWTVEAAIPLSSFKQSLKTTSEWSFNIAHTRTAANELMYWSPVHSDSSHHPERFGKLTGMKERQF